MFPAWPCWLLVDMNVVESQQSLFNNPQGQQQYRLRTPMSCVWELYVLSWFPRVAIDGREAIDCQSVPPVPGTGISGIASRIDGLSRFCVCCSWFLIIVTGATPGICVV